jgi:hypothetical protein
MNRLTMPMLGGFRHPEVLSDCPILKREVLQPRLGQQNDCAEGQC